MKHTQEMYVHADKYDETRFILYGSDMSEYGDVLVAKQIVEFDVPDNFDPVPIKMAMLTAQEGKLCEEFSNRMKWIKEEKSKLQALTYEGTT